jgi:putative ABC transport system substrate-binding protein
MTAEVVAVGRRGLVLAGLCLAPFGGLAAPNELRRLAYLSIGRRGTADHLLAAFFGGLRERGWIEDTNLAVDRRYADGDLSRVPALAGELLATRPDVIVASNDEAALLVARVTSTVPIVFALGFDPVGVGVVRSLARPGGNVTGLSALHDELIGKRLGLLKQLLPQMRRAGVLYHADDARAMPVLDSIRRAADAVGVSIDPLPVRGRDDLAPAVARTARSGGSALLSLPSVLFIQERAALADLALKQQLAAAFGATEFADAGMLLAYGADFATIYRRAGYVVDRVLRGTPPAEIPVEQANVFEFVLNLKTARALGIKVPNSVLLQATRVIE